MGDAVTAVQMWAPLVGAFIAALAGMRSWRIVGRTEGVVYGLEKAFDRALIDIEENRKDALENRKAAQEHSGAIRALTTAVARFDNIPRLIKELQDKIDHVCERLDGGQDGREGPVNAGRGGKNRI